MQSFRNVAVCLFVVLTSVSLPSVAPSQETRPSAQQPATAGAEAHKDAEKEAAPIPPEKAVTTHHELTLGGKTLKYTATAGTLLIRDEDDKPYGSMFYVAYTLDGAEANTRAGKLSLQRWAGVGDAVAAHGLVSRRCASRPTAPSPTAGRPSSWCPNQYSLLDKTDLVFIDAPLTGYSRAVGKGTPKDFAGVDGDLHAFDHFIIRYLTVNQRWNSPKFLIGESYGTTRSAGLADMLGNDGVQLNGVVLISSILNFGVWSPGYDDIFIFNLPSYAAAAWYFDKIPNKQGDLAEWVQQARDFASGPTPSPFSGHNLPAAQLEQWQRRSAG